MKANSNAPGPRALRKWMSDADLSSKELSVRLSTDPRNVSRWRRGVVNPCADTRILISELSGGLVPITAWCRAALHKAA